jgi:aminoglycoside phosphotransferase (APT) family kinase protein
LSQSKGHASLMTVDSTAVEAIIAHLGMEVTALDFLVQGATSRVWRAETPDGPVVIRLGDPLPGKTAGFGADAGARRRILQAGGRVAEPLAVGRLNGARAEDDTGIAWCIDRYVAGETSERGEIPERVCRDLGELLYRMHELPVVGYGLLQDRQDELVGRASDPASGLLTRLQDPWPLGQTALDEHPIAGVAPDLLEPLMRLRDRLNVAVTAGQPCLNHTDLHERQILIADGRLACLLDFGDATIGPPAWDVASFAYFHGWRPAGVLLEGYTGDTELRRRMLASARDFAVLIALHHASRSVTLRRRQRMQSATAFLRSLLAGEMPQGS